MNLKHYLHQNSYNTIHNFINRWSFRRVRSSLSRSVCNLPIMSLSFGEKIFQVSLLEQLHHFIVKCYAFVYIEVMITVKITMFVYVHRTGWNFRLRMSLDYVAKISYHLHNLSGWNAEVVLGMLSFECISAREDWSSRSLCPRVWSGSRLVSFRLVALIFSWFIFLAGISGFPSISAWTWCLISCRRLVRLVFLLFDLGSDFVSHILHSSTRVFGWFCTNLSCFEVLCERVIWWCQNCIRVCILFPC